MISKTKLMTKRSWIYCSKTDEKNNSGKTLQDFKFDVWYPPQVGVKYNYISAFPMFAMLSDGALSYNPIRYSVNDGIVWVWFQKEWCPIELNCGIVFLKAIKKPIKEIQRLISNINPENMRILYDTKIRINLGSEDSKWIEGFHGFGIFGDERVKKANHGNILAAIERISNKKHPLPSQCLKHQCSIEPV